MISQENQCQENKLDYHQCALTVIETEASAIARLSQSINQDFEHACKLMLNCQGRIIVMGMGKSGHIAKKIAATMASTGTPAFYIHPGEANHGDLGMVTSRDIVLLLSYSGETHEVLNLLPLIKRLNAPIIAMTGKNGSSLARAADIILDVNVDAEACPLGLAPTASTTAALVMGDALAMTLLQARGFTAEEFAFSHPAGQLGKRLLLRVSDIMENDDAIPSVGPTANISQAIIEMTQKGLGCTTVIQANQVLGIFTDGDLRRALDKKIDIQATSISAIMTKKFKSINKNKLVVEALEIMQANNITALIVLDDAKQFCGMIHIHPILRSGVV
ncbi:MAG: KpsF/GutQ family sugar-phosphate isomerase [Pseudomonadota bacterium]